MQKRKDEAQLVGLNSWWMGAVQRDGKRRRGERSVAGAGEDGDFHLDRLSSGAYGMSKWRCPVGRGTDAAQGRASSTQLGRESKPWQPHSSSPAPASDARGPGWAGGIGASAPSLPSAPPNGVAFPDPHGFPTYGNAEPCCLIF